MEILSGIDEAGRGCVAGSLFVAAVVLPIEHKEEFAKLGIKDSKQLQPEVRNKLAGQIRDYLKNHRGFCKVIKYDNKAVDELGLSECMKRAVKRLSDFSRSKKASEVAIDGNTNFGNKTVKPIVRGDTVNVLIAAASILAKFHKDQEMLELHKEEPQYDFCNNKGYLSETHKIALEKHGYGKYHRTSCNIKALPDLAKQEGGVGIETQGGLIGYALASEKRAPKKPIKPVKPK